MQSKLKNKNEINKIFEILSSNNPDPKGELNYTNNYTLLVAVILSAQATDTGVNKATSELFKYYDTPRKMLELGEEGLKTYIKSIGLYNSKAKSIIKASYKLETDYNGKVPNNFQELIKLPGVGRKTANVVLNIAFGKPTLAVDTHVFRTSKRIGLAIGETTEKVEEELMAKIPVKWLKSAHHWLILHGRYICKASSPKCSECALTAYCNFYNYDLNK